MTGFKIWLLILNLVLFMSGWACTTARDGSYKDYKDRWIVIIIFVAGVAIFSIICSFLPIG